MASFVVSALLLLVIAGGCSTLEFNENVHRVQLSGSQCVVDVAHNFFDEFSTIALVRIEREIKSNLNVGISTDDLIMQHLFNEGSWTIMMKYYGQSQLQEPFPDFGFEKIHNYVMVVQNLGLLGHVLEDLSRATSWNPHANFLIYVDGLQNNWRQFCSDTIALFWKYWVINLTIMIPSEEIYGHLFVTWFPYNDGNCGQADVELVQIGICMNSNLEPEDFQGFPTKVPTDLNRCPVQVGTVNSPPFVVVNSSLMQGIEWKLIQTVAIKANFEIKLSISYLSDPEVSLEGVFKELQERRVEVVIGTIAPTIVTHRVFDFSVQYTQDKATWIVPSDETVPQWLYLLMVFQPSSYAATFALLVFFCAASSTIMWAFRGFFRQEYKIFRNPVSFAFITVGILFSNIPSKFPKSTFLRYLIVVWLLFCLHWSTAYSGTLISVLTSTVLYSGIETEADILEMKLNMSLSNRTLRYFNRLSTEDSEVIPTNPCFFAEECLQEMSEKRQMALAMSRIHFDYVKDQFKDKEGNFPVKALKTDIVTSPIEMLLSKGNPLLNRINEILLYIIESGLIDYWTTTLTKEKDSKGESQSTQKVLTLKNLQGGFIILTFGLGLSFIVFIFELLNNRARNKRCNGNKNSI